MPFFHDGSSNAERLRPRREHAVRGLLLGEVRSPLFLLLPLLVYAGAAVGQEAAAIPPSEFEGKPIRRIDFDPPSQPMSRDELDRLLPFHIGDPLHTDAVRGALDKLYATGRYSDISIDAQPDGDGAALRIATEFNFFVGKVTIDGASDPPNRNQLLTAAKLELGAPFVPADMTQAVENMETRLRANGLYHSHIQYRLDRNPSTEEVGIVFDLDTGPRARFDSVNLTGKFMRPRDEIVRVTRWRRGLGPILFPGWREATENRVQTGVERVRQNFQKNDRLLAAVTLSRLDYHELTNTVTPTLAINNGPLIEVTVTGASLSRGKMRQLLPIYEERTIDRSLLVEGNRNLVDYFQSQGFFDAQSDFQQESGENEIETIAYLVNRGERHKLTGIEIDGNHFFTDATLRERLSIREAGWFRFRNGHYSQKLRDQDRDSIRDLYRANGFRDVSVLAMTVDNYRGRRDELGVRFEIREGEQWFVDKLTLTGVSDDDAKYLKGVLESTDGQGFSDANIAADRDTVLTYFLNNGYPNVTFDWNETPGSASNRVNLEYVVKQGERLYVRGVLVRGLDATNPSLVSRRILVKPGEPVSQTEITQSQQKLYDLGVFARVQTALQNPDGDETDKYVLFGIDEANRYSFTMGVGAELARIGGGVTTLDNPAGVTGFSPRVSVGISRLNTFGLAHTASLQGLVSTIEQRALATYLIPQFTGNENLAVTLSALFDNSRDVPTFSAHRREGSIQLSQRLTRANSLQYRFTFRRSTLSDVKIFSGLVPLLNQPVRVGLVSMSFIQDRRDNSTDTHRGMFNTIDAGISLPQFGSETDFTRVLFRNSTYHPIGKDFVIARTLQFGYMQRLAGLNPIPLAELFFSGGSSTQRAFPDNQAGPRDPETGFPIGGQALLFHSTEFRFPLYGDNVGGVIFHDMGNVYSNINSISFRFHQENNQDFNYMVHAIGFGIRYRTPLGPIRVDLSYSPNPPKFVGLTGNLSDLLTCNPANPNPTPMCQAVPQSINRFQFHFSLGQTF